MQWRAIGGEESVTRSHGHPPGYIEGCYSLRKFVLTASVFFFGGGGEVDLNQGVCPDYASNSRALPQTLPKLNGLVKLLSKNIVLRVRDSHRDCADI